MKKIKLFAVSALVLGFVFTGCNKEPANTSDDTKKVAEVPVTDVAVVDGKAAEQKETIKNADDFNKIVLPALEKEVQEAVENIFKGEKSDSTHSISSLGINLARGAETITIDAIEKAFEDFPEEFQKSAKVDEQNMTASVDFDWKAPTGKVDMEIEGEKIPGVSAEITALDLTLKGSAAADKTTGNIKGSGNAAANAGGSISIESLDSFGISVIKSAKANLLVSAKASNIAAEVTQDILPKMAVSDDSEQSTESEINPMDAIVSLSGKIAVSEGFDSAFFFDVTADDGKEYNGVIKANISASVNEDLSKDKIKSYYDAITAASKKEGGLSGKDIDKLPVKISIVVSVYDVKGSKLFDYINVDSFEKLEAEVKKFSAE